MGEPSDFKKATSALTGFLLGLLGAVAVSVPVCIVFLLVMMLFADVTGPVKTAVQALFAIVLWGIWLALPIWGGRQGWKQVKPAAEGAAKDEMPAAGRLALIPVVAYAAYKVLTGFVNSSYRAPGDPPPASAQAYWTAAFKRWTGR